jgi:hypothetical protein
MKAELIPIDGAPPIPIDRDVTVLGRREYCDIRIDDPSLSKRHCVLVKTEGLLVVRDLATTNGTKVKGQKVRWAALLPNDRIAFGTVKFQVYLGPDDVLAPSERVAKGLPMFAPVGGPPPAPAATAKLASVASRPAPRFEDEDDLVPLSLEGPGWIPDGPRIPTGDEDIIELE